VSLRGRRRARLLLLVLTGALIWTAAPQAASAAGSLRLGLADGFGPVSAPAADRDTWLQRVRDTGAAMLRIDASWGSVAPQAPPEADAADPTWAGYAWTQLDDRVRALRAQGITPLLMVTGAPTWAQEDGAPSRVARGAWKPRAAAFGSFLRALAARYSGRFPDPLGGLLPRVDSFQLWNEPNLERHLAPQREGGRAFAATRFRELLNAGYAGVKAEQPDAVVVTGGLAPFGDYSGRIGRTPPVRFLESLLCVDRELRRSCRQRTSVDAISHHPYAVRAPSSPALNPDDVTIPDLGKLTRVVRAARRAGTLGPKTPQLWVTEVSYDSAPPDPRGVPTARLSRWTAELLWHLWRQGVRTALWFQVRDQPAVPDYASTSQSGLFRLDGGLKPSAHAFRFPLVVTGKDRRRLRVWFRSPREGQVSVQVRRGSRWHTVRRVRSGAGDVRQTSVPVARTGAVRAVVGGVTSYAWSGSPARKIQR